LRILGTLLPQRSPALPEIPTMIDAGMPSVSVPSWQAIFGPPNTPHNIVDYMFNQINLALRDPSLVTQFDSLMLKVEASTPESLASVIGQNLEKWRVFIHENNILQD